MKRRDFLEKTLMTSFGTALVPTIAAAKNDLITLQDNSLFDLSGPKIVYAVEGGQFGIDKQYVLGFLVCDETSDAAFEMRCTQTRTALNFNSKLDYSSNDQFKSPYATGLINYFVGANNVSFHALVVDIEKVENISLTNDISFKQKEIEKLKYYQQLATLLNLPTTTRFLMKSQSPFGPSSKFKGLFNQKIANSAVAAMNTLDSNVLQFAGFLAGVVRSELQKSTQNGVKLTLNTYLMQQLNLTSIQIGANKEGKFKITAAS